MAETHVLMHVVAFAGAMWWTKGWLLEPVAQRWRFIIAAFAGAILWVFVAFASTRVVDASSGVVVAYGSMALAWLSVFMAVVSVAGIILGLLLWTEESYREAVDDAPEGFGVRGDD